MNGPSLTENLHFNGWCGAIAEELHRIADDFAKAAHHELPEPRLVALHIQPGGRADRADDEVIAAVDALGAAIAGKPGSAERMSDGTYHYEAGCQRGPIAFKVYREISAARVERMAASQVLADKEAELNRLRAEVEKLRAESGLSYSREVDDPTPVSPGHPPLHFGAMVDSGELIDETPSEAR